MSKVCAGEAVKESSYIATNFSGIQSTGSHFTLSFFAGCDVPQGVRSSPDML
jgi:hypothetical protein